ncbi:hypothetical protein BBP40_002169 [Aspergillus hancockii]|nr:hypothetical protein BBP40_002169 [Aspergillus hancockii]
MGPQWASADERQPLWATPDELEDDSTRTSGDCNNKRHLGIFSTTLLLANRMIGAAIFSVPSSILLSVGSVGAALSLWLLGLILTLCGFYIWLELGSLMPRTGGEKVYLETAYPRPYRLLTTIYAVYVLLAFPGLSSVVVTDNTLLALGVTASEAGKRIFSIAVLILVSALLSISREWSVRIANSLTLLKLAILSLIILSALAIVVGVIPSEVDVNANFRQPFAGSSTNIYDYTVALFKVLESFLGWNNASLVLGEVKNPRKTLKVAGLLGVGSVGVLYLLVNVSYFVVAKQGDIGQAGMQLVARLLGNIFGSATTRVTAAMVALSSLGSLVSTAFAFTRVFRELGIEGAIPAAGILAKTTPSGNPAPTTSAFVFGASVVAIALLPFGDAYAFLLDVSQYELAIIYCAVAIGLFIIRQSIPATEYPFRVWTWVPCVFLTCQVCLVVSPFISPSGASDTNLPYWLTPAVALLVFGFGVLYWRWNRVSTSTVEQQARIQPDTL